MLSLINSNSKLFLISKEVQAMDQEQFIPEHIVLFRKKRNGSKEYVIKWQNYSYRDEDLSVEQVIVLTQSLPECLFLKIFT